MSASLFLDDERDPKTARDWIIVRDYEQACQACAALGLRGPDYVSFDHDLGDGPTGYDFAKWLIENDISKPGWLPADFDFNVHSANIVGRMNIEGLLNNYLAFRVA